MCHSRHGCRSVVLNAHIHTSKACMPHTHTFSQYDMVVGEARQDACTAYIHIWFGVSPTLLRARAVLSALRKAEAHSGVCLLWLPALGALCCCAICAAICAATKCQYTCCSVLDGSMGCSHLFFLHCSLRHLVLFFIPYSLTQKVKDISSACCFRYHVFAVQRVF